MAFEFNLPDIGEGVSEGEVVQWLVAEGDSVTEDQPIVEVMTDKATVEVASPKAGTIEKILVKEGDMVAVGKGLAMIAQAGGSSAQASSEHSNEKTDKQPTPAPSKQTDEPQHSDQEKQTQAPSAQKPSGGSSSFEFNLPDIGEGVSEGEVVQWLVAVGDTIKEDQAVVEVMTDKATVEVASPKAGTVEKLVVDSGDMIQVGKPLMTIQTAGGKAPSTASAPEEAPKAKQEAPKTAASSIQKQDIAIAGSNVLAAPITRKYAREQGIDINQVQGSGKVGRVTLDDVKAFASKGAPTSTTQSPATQQPAASPTQSKKEVLSIPASRLSSEKTENRIPVRGIRRLIVENMRNSLDHAAHFSHMDEMDATNLVAARNALKDRAEAYGVKLNYLPFIVKALVESLKLYPRLNASYDEQTKEIVEKGYYNIGIAVATKDEDLVVPVIHNADQKGLLQIGKEIKELAVKAQTNKLTPADFTDGTFTVTSLGPVAGTYATPIINYPEVGILGFYAIKERPVVYNGEIAIRSMATLSFSIDHRIVDGYLGAKFTKTFIEFLENPEMMLMF